MTAALEGGEWSAARPGRTLPPEKTRYPLYRRLRNNKIPFINVDNLKKTFNPLNTELNPACHLLALKVAHPILDVSRIKVKKHERNGRLLEGRHYLFSFLYL